MTGEGPGEEGGPPVVQGPVEGPEEGELGPVAHPLEVVRVYRPGHHLGGGEEDGG